MRNKNCNCCQQRRQWVGEVVVAVAAFLTAPHSGNSSQVPAAVWLLLPMNECTCCLCLGGLSALPQPPLLARSAVAWATASHRWWAGQSNKRRQQHSTGFKSDSSARGHATHFAVCCCCCSFCCHCFHFCCCPLLLRKPRGCRCYCCRFWGGWCCCSCFSGCSRLWGIWYLQMCWQWICRPATNNISCLPLYHDPFLAIRLHSIRSVAMQLQLVVNSIFTLFWCGRKTR